MRTKLFLEKLAHDRITNAIAEAEKKTSGEIRVFIQRGAVVDPVTAAQAQFQKLGMSRTRERNGILIFVAPRSQKFAVIGDEAIHQKCGEPFWEQLVGKMQQHFRVENFTEAMVDAIAEAGATLAQHFPRKAGDRNELPDTIEEG
jgi:uncharacterized membrane protein